MDFQRIYDEGLAQASYLVACAATGEALIVDPTRDIDQYLDLIASKGYELTAVAETHIHADFLSGARELVASTGATLYVSGEQGEGWEYDGLDDLPVVYLRDRDTFSVGNIELEALHTPGHTPEHMSYLVTDHAKGHEPVIALTGDFLFVGDLGRPDLLEAAAGEAGTADVGARQQYASLTETFLELPDDVQVWPGHGAGSACGSALGSVASSTVGYERKTTWWREFTDADGPGEDAFVDRLLSGQPESPTYFGRMKEVNRDGVPHLGETPRPRRLYPGRVDELLDDGARIVDLRDVESFAADHVVGAYNLPKLQEVSTHAGWVLEGGTGSLILVGERSTVDEAARRLVRVGFDDIAGFVSDLDALADASERSSVPLVDVEQVHDWWSRDEATIVDVRSKGEYADGHIPNALHRHYGSIEAQLDEIPRDERLVVHCASGIRANIAVSVLEANGFTDVVNFPGGFTAWDGAGHAVEA
jgi:hydroxyacylglutathione hydrolase